MVDDEFCQYVRDLDNLCISKESNRIRVWGYRAGENQVSLLGFSFHFFGNWETYSEEKLCNLRSLGYLAKISKKPLLWLGETDCRWDKNMGKVEIGVVEYNDGSINTSLNRINVSECESYIQNVFGTSYSIFGTQKEVNVRSNSFQDWGRVYLPTDYVPNDIDILTVNNKEEPTAFIEVKRSDYGKPPRKKPVIDWYPFKNEWRNYLLQLITCKKTGILPIIIQHKKEPVEDNSLVGYYLIKEIDSTKREWMDFDREIIEAAEAKNRLKDMRDWNA